MLKLKTSNPICNLRKGLEMENDFSSHKPMTEPALLTFPVFFFFIIHIFQAKPDVTILLEAKSAVISSYCYF